MITKLILSPGEIDMDDALAASILLAKEPSIVSIDRYHPDQGEFEDSTLAIVGMGVNKPSRSVFGGQAGALNTDIVASCTSVAEHYGIVGLMRSAFSWWKMLEDIKINGPAHVANTSGIAHGTAFMRLFPGPFGDMAIERVNRIPGKIKRDDPPVDMLQMYGDWLVFLGKRLSDSMERVAPDSVWERHTGQMILGFRHLPDGMLPRDVSLWASSYTRIVATVLPDRRSDGGWVMHSVDLKEVSLRHLALEACDFVNGAGTFARINPMPFEKAMAVAVMAAQATRPGGVWAETPWEE